MEKSEKIALLVDAYNRLRVRGIVKTQGDFAKMLGVSQSSVSGARHGDDRYLTNALIERVQALIADTPGFAPQSPAIKREDEGGVFIPEKTLELYTSLAKTCDRLSAIVDRMMPAAQSGGKNYSADVLK